MKLNIGKSLIAVAVGVADVAAERYDEKHGKTSGSFKSAEDWLRLVAVLGGHGIGMFMPQFFEQGETVAIAATPLLVKSLADAMEAHTTGTGGGTGKFFAPRVVSGAGKRNWIPSQYSGPGYRPFGGA